LLAYSLCHSVKRRTQPIEPTMSDSELVIYHNPRCGKSRAALALLGERGATPRVIEYLKTPPTRAELARIVARLGIPAADLVRRSEEIYKTQYVGKTLTEAQWLDALAAHPILIERPIAVRGDRAVIGRPPERVLELL
jgi:arsenate reductase